MANRTGFWLTNRLLAPVLWYARDGATVWVLMGRAERSWWPNLPGRARSRAHPRVAPGAVPTPGVVGSVTLVRADLAADPGRT